MYNFKGKLDDKNRLTIPADLRSEFSGPLVVTPGFDGSLHLYTENVWEQELEPALKVKIDDDQRPTILNQQLAAQADFFYSDLQQTRHDDRGRLTIEYDLVVRADLHEVRDFKAVRVPTETGHYWKIRRADRRPKL
jgi:DNA-binding transcriptional regulator/RsmH inhibitor MraZ